MSNCFLGCKDPACVSKASNNKNTSLLKREALEIVLEMLYDHKIGRASLLYKDLIEFGQTVLKFNDGNFANKTGTMPQSHCLNLNCSKDASCNCQCAICLGIDQFSFKRTGHIRRTTPARRYYDRRGILEEDMNENQNEQMPESAQQSLKSIDLFNNDHLVDSSLKEDQLIKFIDSEIDKWGSYVIVKDALIRVKEQYLKIKEKNNMTTPLKKIGYDLSSYNLKSIEEIGPPVGSAFDPLRWDRLSTEDKLIFYEAQYEKNLSLWSNQKDNKLESRIDNILDRLPPIPDREIPEDLLNVLLEDDPQCDDCCLLRSEVEGSDEDNYELLKHCHSHKSFVHSWERQRQ